MQLKSIHEEMSESVKQQGTMRNLTATSIKRRADFTTASTTLLKETQALHGLVMECSDLATRVNLTDSDLSHWASSATDTLKDVRAAYTTFLKSSQLCM